MTSLATNCVDGCIEVVRLVMLPNDDLRAHRDWRVQHGDNPEHSRIYDHATLFVTTGFSPWAQEIHERENNAPA